jgi:hypothetical protein
MLIYKQTMLPRQLETEKTSTASAKKARATSSSSTSSNTDNERPKSPNTMRKKPFVILKKINSNYTRLLDKLNSSLSPFQLGVFLTLLTLSFIQLITLILNYSNFVLIICSFLKLSVNIFCILSLFTWLTLIYGKNWSDTNVYLVFITCFLTEFFIQFFLFNLSTAGAAATAQESTSKQFDLSEPTTPLVPPPSSSLSSTSSSSVAHQSPTSSFMLIDNIIGESNEATSAKSLNNFNGEDGAGPSRSDLLGLSSGSINIAKHTSNINSSRSFEQLNENVFYAFLICSICIMNCFYINVNLIDNMFIIAISCLTRLYGTVYFANVLPVSICSYFAYLCAISGVFLSHYIRIRILNDHGQHGQRPQQSTSTTKKHDSLDTKANKTYANEMSTSSGSIISDLLHHSKKSIKQLPHSVSLRFHRRTSLPTIPIKYEKVCIFILF